MGTSSAATNATPARNFPKITSEKVTGMVRSISYDPTLSSSENNRMVMAGTTNEKIMGRSAKKFLRLAWLKRKKVEKKNHPTTTRNMDITI